jgi:hypothetical protein
MSEQRGYNPEHHPEEPQRIGAGTRRDIASFQEFISLHGKELEQAMAKGVGASDFIYDKFQTEETDGQAFVADAGFARLKETYDHQAKALIDRFLSLSKKYEKDAVPRVSPGKKSIEKGWAYFKVNGGAINNKSEKLGRAYLNIKPENLVAFYEEAMPMFQQLGLAVDAKIAGSASVSNFNRSDKMVIYFNEKDEAGVLAAIEDIHQRNASKFLPQNPKFTAQLVNENGFVMDGVSFGEEPDQGGASFGEIRARIMAGVYNDARQHGYAMTDARATDAFRRECTARGVDASEAAFNAGGTSFAVMRRRTNEVFPNKRPQP